MSSSDGSAARYQRRRGRNSDRPTPPLESSTSSASMSSSSASSAAAAAAAAASASSVENGGSGRVPTRIVTYRELTGGSATSPPPPQTSGSSGRSDAGRRGDDGDDGADRRGAGSRRGDGRDGSEHAPRRQEEREPGDPPDGRSKPTDSRRRSRAGGAAGAGPPLSSPPQEPPSSRHESRRRAPSSGGGSSTTAAGRAGEQERGEVGRAREAAGADGDGVRVLEGDSAAVVAAAASAERGREDRGMRRRRRTASPAQTLTAASIAASDEATASGAAASPSGKSRRHRLKVTSPTTGATITLGEVDIRAASATPSLGERSQGGASSSGAGAADGIYSARPTSAAVSDASHVIDVDEEQRLRTLLSSTAAVKGTGRGSGASKKPGRDAAKRRDDEPEISPVIEAGDPDVVFFDDGGKFRQLFSTQTNMTDDEMDSQQLFDQQLRGAWKAVDACSSYVLQCGHGIYSGLCVLSLAALPTQSPLPLSGERCLFFIAYYSQMAVGTNRLFAFFGTLAVLATLVRAAGIPVHRERPGGASKWWASHGKHGEGTYVRRPWLTGAIRWWRRRSGRAQLICAVLSVVCVSVSYLMTIVMLRIDDRLFESQAEPYGGYYGDTLWFKNPVLTNTTTNITTTTATTAPSPPPPAPVFAPLQGNDAPTTLGTTPDDIQSDIDMWAASGCARGVLGVLSWVCTCLCRLLGERRKAKSGSGGGVGSDGSSGRARSAKVGGGAADARAAGKARGGGAVAENATAGSAVTAAAARV
ncbi:hypothetical protein DFJ73DRAFT_960377 [Zopfochytrium polystomum]|nr:hypothetical protein DFJ73DRAFT_960377 [Zopfochytrium polystomum]